MANIVTFFRIAISIVLLFLLPLTIPVFPLKFFTVVVCGVATIAAIKEGYMIRTGDPTAKGGYEHG